MLHNASGQVCWAYERAAGPCFCPIPLVQMRKIWWSRTKNSSRDRLQALLHDRQATASSVYPIISWLHDPNLECTPECCHGRHITAADLIAVHLQTGSPVPQRKRTREHVGSRTLENLGQNTLRREGQLILPKIACESLHRSVVDRKFGLQPSCTL
jgi:hypothetical protein